MTPAYVGLGSNLGDARTQIQNALQELRSLPRTELLRASSLYRSAPMGYADQPDFLNSVARLDSALEAEALLAGLKEIERRHGRSRSFANAPRTLDLDLLLFGDSVMQAPGLTLPHPRMHERAFVLAPLAEIAPGASVPGRGRVEDLLAACKDQRIVRIA